MSPFDFMSPFDVDFLIIIHSYFDTFYIYKYKTLIHMLFYCIGFLLLL